MQLGNTKFHYNFDSAAFLQSQSVDKLETQFTPVPAGEYAALCIKLDAKEQPKPDGGVWTILDVTWQIDDARAKEATGMEKPTVRQSFFLDLENGKIASGKNKNVQLGRLLDGLGLNDGGPITRIAGCAAKLQIVVQPDKQGVPRANVAAVGKL